MKDVMTKLRDFGPISPLSVGNLLDLRTLLKSSVGVSSDLNSMVEADVSRLGVNRSIVMTGEVVGSVNVTVLGVKDGCKDADFKVLMSDNSSELLDEMLLVDNSDVC